MCLLPQIIVPRVIHRRGYRSGKRYSIKSDVVELVARILPEETYTLTNGSGMQLSLPEGSVEIPSQLSLGNHTSYY